MGVRNTERIGEHSEWNFVDVAFRYLSFVQFATNFGESNPGYDYKISLDPHRPICQFIGTSPIYVECKSSLRGVNAHNANHDRSSEHEPAFDRQRLIVINSTEKLEPGLVVAQVVHQLIDIAVKQYGHDAQTVIDALEKSDPQLIRMYDQFQSRIIPLPATQPQQTYSQSEGQDERSEKSRFAEPDTYADANDVALCLTAAIPGIIVEVPVITAAKPSNSNSCLRKIDLRFTNGLGSKMIRSPNWFMFYDGLTGSSRGAPIESNLSYFAGIISMGYGYEMMTAELLAQLIAYHGMGEQLLKILKNPSLPPHPNLSDFISQYHLEDAWDTLLQNHFELLQYRGRWLERICGHLRKASKKDKSNSSRRNTTRNRTGKTKTQNTHNNGSKKTGTIQYLPASARTN
ncbi:MAG TPA: hypothetical protein PKX78_01020 [Candidatus Woesebacteria bacterium]|nr:hypothetical protein [Candidatus Woesebacteria bacterium]